MSSFELYKIWHHNVKLLEEMLDELAEQPELRDELNEYFQGLNGVRGPDEFSRCIAFFFLGRLYERQLNQKGD